MAAYKPKAPKALRPRLRAVAKAHDFASENAVIEHFITRGLKAYGAPDGDLPAQLERVVDDQGYSSTDELIEHLLLRGLRAYESEAGDPARLQARLRGLGYID